MDFFRFLMSDVFSELAVLIGLIALIGLITQKKPVTGCIKDTVKTTMGLVTLDAGAGLVMSSLSDFANISQHTFGIQSIVPNNEAIVSVAQKSFGGEMAMIIFFAMVINITIVRFTPQEFVFLTGHRTLFMSIMVAVTLATAGMTGITLIAVDSLVVGMAMISFPAIARPYMKKVTGSDDSAIGRLPALSYVLAGFVGSKFGNKEHSTEDMNVLKSLLFLHDTPVAISFTISIIFLVTCLFMDADAVKELSGGKNWSMFSTIQSVTFAAGVYIILQGACMVITEVVSAFRGIPDKLIPDARPALDCSIVFPYAPNTVLVGFLSSFATGLISMFTLCPLNMIAITPSVMPHFFVDTVAGVFGNTTSGRRGTILGAFTRGLLITFLPVFLLPVLGGIGLANATFSDADFSALGILLGIIVR